VIVAFGTHLEIGFKIFLPQDLFAPFTFYPEAFGVDALFGACFKLLLLLKPSHVSDLLSDGVIEPLTQWRP